MSTFGMNLRVTTDSKQGGRKYMEDMISIKFKKSEDGRNIEYTYLAIFDGHGGSEAAKFAKEHLLDEITKQNGFWSTDDSQVMKAIKDGFLSCHTLMKKNIHMWPQTVLGHPSTSGTTVSVVFIKNGKLYIAHVGDSSVVLGSQHKTDNAQIAANCVTIDHKPECPKELKRIQSNGGAVVAKAGVQRVVWNRPKKPHQGPIRRSTPIDKIPFLAIARALGDLWSYNSAKDVYVVSPEPDVSAFTVDLSKHRYIILASDGLWNMVKPQEAVNVVKQLDEQSKDPYNGVKPASVLVRLALDKWAVRSLRADNTSVIVAYLDPPSSAQSPTGLSKQPSAASSATTFRLGSEEDDNSLSDLDTSDEDLDLEYDQTSSQNHSHLHMGMPVLPPSEDTVQQNVSPSSFSRTKGAKMSLKLTTPPKSGSKMQRLSEPPSSAPPKLHRVHSTQVLEKLPKYCKQQSSPSKLDSQKISPKSPNTRSVCANSVTHLPSAAKGLSFDTHTFKDKKESKWALSEKPMHNLRVRKHSASQDDKYVSPKKQARYDQTCSSGKGKPSSRAGVNEHVSSPSGRMRSLSVGNSSHLRLEEEGPRQAVTAKSPLKVETSALQSPTSAMISPIWPKSLDRDLGEGSLTALDSRPAPHESSCLQAEPCSSGHGKNNVNGGVHKVPCEVLQENSSVKSKVSAVKGFLKLFSQGSQNKAPVTRGGLKRRASTEGAAPPKTKRMRGLPKASKLHTKVLHATRLKRRSRALKKRKP